MRNIVYRFDDTASAALALAAAGAERELPLPIGETIRDGEWVLAVFEVGSKEVGTAAARGLRQDADEILSFERRDWDRLNDFVTVRGEGQGPASGVPDEPPTKPSLADDLKDGPTSSKPSSRSDVPDGGSSAKSPFSGGPWSSANIVGRVLLVDDERDIREVVSAMLEAVGLVVDTVGSAEEGLERMRGSRYDLAVLDWSLPGITGVELCRLIRRDPRLSTLPVLFLTGHIEPNDVVEAFASGGDDYVAKPFRAPELGARIFGLLRRARMVTQSADS